MEEGETSPPSVLDDLPDEQRDEVAEKISREIMLGMSWSGRLPRPSDLQAYDDIVPGAARQLVEELLQEGRLAQQSIDLDRDVSNRVLNLMDAQHDLERDESQDDRTFRRDVFHWLKWAFYLPPIIVIITLFAPIGGWQRAIIIAAVLLTSIAPICIVLVRGRITPNERDVINSMVPQVTAAVSAALRSERNNTTPENNNPTIDQKSPQALQESSKEEP